MPYYATPQAALEAYRRERKRLLRYLLMDEPRKSRYWRERAINQLIVLRNHAGLTPWPWQAKTQIPAQPGEETHG